MFISSSRLSILIRFMFGYTENIEQRLETHSSGGSIHTASSRPWELVMHFVFKDKQKAMDFETYLKSHSGRAFLAKRFL